jgi:hypothetical protein
LIITKIAPAIAANSNGSGDWMATMYCNAAKDLAAADEFYM